MPSHSVDVSVLYPRLQLRLRYEWLSYFNRVGDFESAIEIWWDKDTGLMVKMTWWYPAGPLWENNTLIATTAWSVSSASTQGLFSTTNIVLIGGVGLVALVVGVLIGRRGKK